MANACSANYVDRLLMKLDGAVTPIWNSLFFSVSTVPQSALLFSSMNALINEVPRLKSMWSMKGKGWQVVELTSQDRASVYQFDSTIRLKDERIHCLIKTPIDLNSTLPFHLSVGRTTCNNGQSWLIGFQLHHVAGDGRALMHLVQRFWNLLAQSMQQQPPPIPTLAMPQMRDKQVIKQCWLNKKTIPWLFRAKYRQLARRASSLAHQAESIGNPCLMSHCINLSKLKSVTSSELFYSAILAAIVRYEEATADKLIRLRIPVDLRGLLNIPANSIENGCSAVVLELPLQSLQHSYKNNSQHLGLLLKTQLAAAIKKQIYLSNALECIVTSHLASAKTLKQSAREELLAVKRSSTMVITQFGDVSTYLKPPKGMDVLHIEAHTPVWGANCLVFEGSLYLNITCFDGIWNKETMHKFATHARDWIESQYALM